MKYGFRLEFVDDKDNINPDRILINKNFLQIVENIINKKSNNWIYVLENANGDYSQLFLKKDMGWLN